ncbi:hypothetical protein H1R85_10200, partial [Flavobacterium psychrophilum]|uniref:hypothetical protein n=1 Tax=Flavobacterium psychrophilum TaxID=96345 RepID=UPI001888FC10
ITIPISSGYESNLQKLLNINKIGTAGINPGGDRDDSGLNHAMHQMDDGEIDPPTKHGNKYGTLEEYREWRDYSGYHEGETFFDRWCRNVNSAHMEIMRDEGSGGSLMYGGFGSSSKTLVQFGKVENQVSHTFRHVEAMGLSRDIVKSAILKDIPRIAKNMPYGQSINTTIKVSNRQIIYSSYKLPNGTINVGRITGLTK